MPSIAFNMSPLTGNTVSYLLELVWAADIKRQCKSIIDHATVSLTMCLRGSKLIAKKWWNKLNIWYVWNFLLGQAQITDESLERKIKIIFDNCCNKGTFCKLENPFHFQNQFHSQSPQYKHTVLIEISKTMKGYSYLFEPHRKLVHKWQRVLGCI